MNKLFPLTFLLLSACTDPATERQQDTEKLMRHITYVKDDHGLCYATVVFKTSYEIPGISITNVPCTTVGF